MNRENIIVSVFERDQLLETRACRRLDVADGRRAVLWRDCVWPVDADDRIDIAATAISFFKPIVETAAEFGIVDGADEAWLVLAGSVTIRDAAAGALRSAGLKVIRTGSWLGDPVDGVAGPFFIRFVRPVGDDLRRAIAAILDGKLRPATPKPDPAGRIRALTLELLEMRAALARAAPPPVAELPIEPVDSQADLAAELQRIQEQQIANLHIELTAAEHIRPQPRATRPQDDLARTITNLRPDLKFLRDSLTVLSGEYADRLGFCRAVNELGSGSMTSSWKKIRGAGDWWERHISNGQDDSGRLYAHQRQGRWSLLVSHKAQQDRDIAWLRRQAG